MKQEIGSSIIADGYRVKFLRCLTPLAVSTDADINVYECECEDGHCEAVASDNASCWLIGDEDDRERNREQFLAIYKANGNAVEWESINDPTLREWILARIDEVIDLEDWVVCDEEEWCNWAMLFRRNEVPTKYEFAVDAGFDEPERFLNYEHLPTISLKEYVKSCDGSTTNLVRDTAEEEMAVEKAVKKYKTEN